MGSDVKQYVCRQIGVATDTDDSFDYRKSGDVDSLGLVRLILSLEAKFCFVFTDEDICQPEFNTIGGLVAAIERKMP
ncbi:MAG TPA: acyl carrier protein [Candidatus Paceibacterota bacterium]